MTGLGVRLAVPPSPLSPTDSPVTPGHRPVRPSIGVSRMELETGTHPSSGGDPDIGGPREEGLLEQYFDRERFDTRDPPPTTRTEKTETLKSRTQTRPVTLLPISSCRGNGSLLNVTRSPSTYSLLSDPETPVPEPLFSIDSSFLVPSLITYLLPIPSVTYFFTYCLSVFKHG